MAANVSTSRSFPKSFRICPIVASACCTASAEKNFASSRTPEDCATAIGATSSSVATIRQCTTARLEAGRTVMKLLQRLQVRDRRPEDYMAEGIIPRAVTGTVPRLLHIIPRDDAPQ